jgi:hypothetical protein
MNPNTNIYNSVVNAVRLLKCFFTWRHNVAQNSTCKNNQIKNAVCVSFVVSWRQNTIFVLTFLYQGNRIFYLIKVCLYVGSIIFYLFNVGLFVDSKIFYVFNVGLFVNSRICYLFNVGLFVGSRIFYLFNVGLFFDSRILY